MSHSNIKDRKPCWILEKCRIFCGSTCPGSAAQQPIQSRSMANGVSVAVQV